MNNKVIKLPILRTTMFDDIRNKYGQEFLEEYNEWTKKDSGSPFYLDRLYYFNINGELFKKYLNYKGIECI